jgi:class 3 adenylate cyclase
MPHTRYARNGEVSIAYQVAGDGPLDLLYVPPSLSQVEHLLDHPSVARFFERMAAFSRVIAFDRRESGLSDRFGRPPTLEEQMDDVVAVLDAVGSENAGMWALLEGGPMAMLFAATYPERVSALVLYASFARTTRAPGYDWAPTKEERAAHFAQLESEWGTGRQLAFATAPSMSGDDRLLEWLGKLERLAMSPRSARLLNDVNQDLDVRDILPSIRVPTLVLHREGDEGIDVRHSRYLAEHIPNAKLELLPGRDTFPFAGDSESVIGEIEEFLTGERGGARSRRVLSTVLFVDIVGSTGRASELGDARWAELLGEYYRLVRRRLERWQGHEIKTIGDGVLATFDGPARAVRAGEALTRDVEQLGVEVRVGLHTGEIELMNGDVGGLCVHIAARVTAAAEPGEVMVSSTVKDLVVGSGLEFAPRGARELRGIPGEWHLWVLE